MTVGLRIPLSRTSRFHRGFATTFMSDIVARSISAVMTIVLIRFLSISDYAFLVVFLAVGQFVGSAATGGLRMLYVRTEAERVARGTATELPFAAVLMGGLSIIAAIAVTGLLTAELGGVGSSARRLSFVGLCAAYAAGQATVDLVSYHHQASLGFLRGGVVSIWRNFCLLTAAVVASAAFSASGPVTAFALAAASVTAGLVVSGRVLVSSPAQRRIRGTRLGFSPESGWLTLYSLVAAGFAMVDVFIVAIILDQQDVASFGAAQRYYAVALGAVPALEAVLRVRTSQPDIVDSSEAQVSAIRNWVRRLTLPLALLLIALGLLARPVIPLIDQGRYPDSIPVFQILLVGVFAYYVTLPSVNLLMAQRRFALLAVAFASAFVANAVGDFVLGPRFGVVAIAAVATTVLVLLSATVTVCALRGRGPRVRTAGWRSLAFAVRRPRLDARKARAPRRRRAPEGQAWAHVVVLAVVCTLAGVAVASVHQPILLLAVAGLVLTVTAVLLVWGELGIALFLVTTTPLIPVVSGVYGQPKAYAGIDGSTLRTAGVALLSAVALALAGRTDDRDRAVLPLVRPLLLALSGLGLASALFTAVGPSDFVKQAAQATGQPLFYAVAITMFVVALSRFEDAREKLFEAWCWALIVEAIIVVGQVATGAAYDPIRGITRAQGTMGADSLGAFSMFGVFGALTLRSIASTRFARRLAGVAVVASLGMMFLSLARGAVIAFGVALVLLALRGGDQRSQRQLSRGFSLVALTGFVAYLTKDLWLARLSAPTTAGFDRPATWIAGFRIVRAHPVFGAGPSHIVALVQSSTQYGYTEFGTNAAVPHNSWLFAAAANGLPYAGLLLLATVAFVIGIHRAREPSGRFLRAGLFGLLLISFENNLFNHPETMLFVLLAAVASARGLSRTSRSVATHHQGRMDRRASQRRLPHTRRTLSAPLTQSKG